MEKKGQATILIILGIVIVVLAILIMQSRSVTLKEEAAVVVPEQVKGVVSYTNDCLRDLTEEGLNLIGLHGGYIELPNNIRYNPRAYLQTVSGIKVPYWVHGENNLRIPDKETIKKELENYINNNFLNKCSYGDFTNQGYNFEFDEIKSEVTINDDNVYVKLNNKITTNYKDFTFSINDYILAKVNNKIGKMLNAANGLIQRELENGPIEYISLDLIATYSKQDKRIPPVAGMSVSCGEDKWSNLIATNVVRKIINTYISCLKVDNTNYQLCEGQKFFNKMLINNIYNRNYNDIEIGFNYLEEWPFFMDIYPSNGDAIKMDRLKISFPFLNPICINFNWFRYDLRYPILVTIKDDYNNELNFVIEVLIKDNYYRKRLSNLEDNIEPAMVPNFFCDENQKLGNELNLITFDAKTGDNLENVDIIYTCDEYRSCLLGKTELKDGNTVFNSKLPLCQGGELSLMKENYLSYKTKLTSFDKISPKVIEMQPFREKSAKVIVLERDGDYIINERELIDGESVQIQLDRLNNEIGTYDWQGVYTFDFNNKMQDIILVPGSYDLSLDLNWEKGVVLSDLDESVDGVVLGGANFVWNVNEIELDKNNIITFYVVSNGIPKTMSDVERNMNYEEILTKFENRLIPEFIER